MAFVMVLSYSRHLFLRFYLNATMGQLPARARGGLYLLQCRTANSAVRQYSGAVLERIRDAIRFHPTLLDLAAWYHFQSRPVAVARGNEKGRVQRAIRFVRERFFAARRFADLADLNTQALQWCTGEAAERSCPEDRARSVRACFEEGQPRLLALPPEPFPCDERLTVRVHKTPYVRFDLNDYSIPHAHVRRSLVALATPQRVRILDGTQMLATHPRSFDRGQQVEEPTHIQALVDEKRVSRAHRAMDRLHHAAPSAAALFKLAAARGAHLGVLTRGLIELLDTHGAAALESALIAALREDSAHLPAVRHFIDQQRARRGQSPPVAVTLPDDPRVARFTIASDMLHDLAAQDSSTQLARRLRRYTTPTLLSVDEVGYLSYDARYADLLFEVITRRYQLHRPVVLTTNKPFGEWNQVFPTPPSSIGSCIARRSSPCSATAIASRKLRSAPPTALQNDPPARRRAEARLVPP